jgi:FKBP-type peptidyl-prolyl cis-trans isomerase
MRNGHHFILVAGLGFAVARLAVGAESKPEFTNDAEKASYSIGMMLGSQFKSGGLAVDPQILAGAIKDVLSGAELRLTLQEAQDTIRIFQQVSQAKLADRNRREGEAFLAQNKKKEGVKVIEVPLPDGTKAELQYKVVSEGSGPSPKSNDVVVANYRGSFPEGGDFDDSARHGAPLKRPANSLGIRGWTEALQRMQAGSKWQIFIPPSLAYGETAPAAIGPNKTLIFQIELLSFESQPAVPPAAVPVAAPPTVTTPSATPPTSPPAVNPSVPVRPAGAPPAPLTSDIIKVPSAEERKKGAQIEIIRAEDVAKEMEAAKQAEKSQEKKP